MIKITIQMFDGIAKYKISKPVQYLQVISVSAGLLQQQNVTESRSSASKLLPSLLNLFAFFPAENSNRNS